MKLLISSCLLLVSTLTYGQGNSYFYQIPATPEDYTAENVAARMVDGLGFRFYWATDGLRKEDLSYKASDDGRTIGQTVEHIMGLTNVLAYALQSKPYENLDYGELTFDQKREWVLNSLEQSSKILKSEEADLTNYQMIFQGQSGNTEFDFWYLVNGPVADALWHCGQIVTLRRASGNPFNSKVSLLQGNVRQ